MRDKQNIPPILLLLLWAVMFCFSVSYTLHQLPASSFYTSVSTTTADEQKEGVKTEEHDSPVAWAEQSISQTTISAEDLPIQVYTLSFWLLQPTVTATSSKPGKVIVTSLAAITRNLVQPNAP